jgi:dihydroorotase-like cyclic amidohydrolase
MIDTVIVNAKVVTPSDIVHGSISIDGGRIELVGPSFVMPKARQVIDAGGRFVIPGLVDPHVHYGLVGRGSFAQNCMRDWKLDSVGAAFGGVTTVMPMLMAKDSYVPLVKDLQGWGANNSAIDFAFTVIVHQDRHLADMRELFDIGVTAFKHFFTAFKGKEGEQINLAGVEEGYFFRSLETIRALGAPAIAMCHAEDCELYNVFIARERSKGRDGLAAWNDSRPPFTECVRIEMGAKLAYEANAPLYFVHLSNGESIRTVQKYKSMGARLAAEAVIHTLTVSCEQESEVGIWGKFVPPLRPWAEIHNMWRGIRAGVFDTIATDHCTYSLEDKMAGQEKFGSIWDIPPGISNVQEHWLPLLWTDGVKTGRITVHELVKLCSENAARLFGLYPRKGAIIPGADADLVFVDDMTEHVVDESFYHGRDPRLSIYRGRRLIGRPQRTMLRGKVIMKDGVFLGNYGDGCFVPTRLGSFLNDGFRTETSPGLRTMGKH